MKPAILLVLMALEARGFMVVRKNAMTVTSTDGWDLYALYQHEYLDVRTQAGGIELTTRSEPGTRPPVGIGLTWWWARSGPLMSRRPWHSRATTVFR